MINQLPKNHWSKDWAHPYAPNNLDVRIYEDHMVKGTTLLLGCTKKLIRLSERQLDIDPFIQGQSVIKGDWRDNRHFYTNILLDGGLCFTKELCDEVLEMASKNCKKFITRSFNRKLEEMKIAAYFPQETDFHIHPDITIKFNDYSFYVWEFRR